MKNHIQIFADSASPKDGRVVTATGENLPVKSVDIRIRHDEPTTAILELLAIPKKVNAIAEFAIRHPNTGKLKAVERIIFTDGEVVDI